MRVLLILILIIPFWGKAQIHINGKILDEFGFVVPDVLVYIDGSSISTYSDINGQFSLKLPEGNYTLVFRKEDFQNATSSIHSKTKNLEIVLKKLDAIELDEALIVQLSEDKWKEYYNQFISLFLGQNKAAKDCEILNPKSLRFNYDAENLVLNARATEPIKIQNKFLGYTIEYDLVDFSMDYYNQFQYVSGTSLFTEMEGTNSRKKKWMKNRFESYQGSLMHFIRSVYEEKLKENKFVINRLIRKENPDFQIFQQKIQQMIDRGEVVNVGAAPPRIIETLVKAEVPYDSLRIKNTNQIFLNFGGLYDIEFTGEKEDMDHVRMVKGKNLIGNQVSVIYLLNDKLIEIEANGNFYPPSDFMTEGYFTWEKIANLLPLDYEP